MPASGLLIAGAISAAAIPPPAIQRIFKNYPTWAVAERRSAGVQVDLVVDPDGTVRDCQVLTFVGNERLARQQCDELKRYRLEPARDPSGSPIHGRLRTHVKLELDESRDRNLVRRWSPAPDLTVSGLLPVSAREPLDVAVVVLVEPTGTIRECVGDAIKAKEIPAAWAEVACIEAGKATLRAVMDDDGQPVEHVTNMTVRFELSEAA